MTMKKVSKSLRNHNHSVLSIMTTLCHLTSYQNCSENIRSFLKSRQAETWSNKRSKDRNHSIFSCRGAITLHEKLPNLYRQVLNFISIAAKFCRRIRSIYAWYGVVHREYHRGTLCVQCTLSLCLMHTVGPLMCISVR